MPDGIDTGGGGSVGGSVGAGKDFVGRDGVTNNFVAAASNDDRRLSDLIWEDLREVKARISQIESFLAGKLGEPGLTQQVREARAEINRIEKEIELVDMMDARLAKLESLLTGYTQNNVTLDKYVFLAVMVLLVVAIPVTFLMVWFGRGG